MKGPETTRSLPKMTLLYLYEGPRDLHEPLNKEFVLPIGICSIYMKGPETPEASRKGICSTCMKGQETSMSLLTSNLFYLHERPRDLQKPPEKGFVLPI